MLGNGVLEGVHEPSPQDKRGSKLTQNLNSCAHYLDGSFGSFGVFMDWAGVMRGLLKEMAIERKWHRALSGRPLSNPL